MNANENGGPAFPVPGHSDQPGGMSLRDYFAGQVLINRSINSFAPGEIADKCYALADAMLAARVKP